MEKKKVVKIVVIAGVIVLVLAGGGVAVAGRMKTGRAAAGSVADTNRSYEVKKGTISTTVSATGTLEADDVQDMDVLSLLTVDKVYVEAGDTVQKGDLLATVDTVSVKSALQTLQSELESLDSQIEDEKDETVSTKVKASVSGRVKKLYAKKGDGVTDVMQTEGALALLSLDGKMAVDVDTSETVSVGDEVTVTLEDGSTVDGTVEAVSGTKVTVTMTDDGPAYGEAVTVSSEGKALGSGTLYIHSELTVTGYTGTVSSVSVKENQKVSDGTVLFKLKDTGKTAAYEKLVAERAEVADALSQVVALYQDPNLYAEFSGTVQSVDCEDAEVVKTDSGNTESTVDTDNTESAGEKAADEGTADAESNADNSAQKESTDGAGTISENAAESSGVKKTAAVSGTVYDAEHALQTMQVSGGYVSTGMASSGDIRQMSVSQETTVTQSAGNAETDVQTASGDTEGTRDKAADNETGSTSSSGTENGSETAGSSQGSQTPSEGGDSSGAEETEKQEQTISSLQTVVVSTPVAGNTVQKSINSGTGYVATIGWNPAVTGTYSEKTAYTATLTFTAANGYRFDGKLAENYLQAVSADQAQTKAEVSADGKILTVTAVFAETGDSAQGAAKNSQTTQQTTQQTTGSRVSGFSGGSMSGSAVSGYSMSSGTASSAKTSSDTDTAETEQNTLTATKTICMISKDEKMKVSVSVDEQDILNLSAGQTAQVTLDAVDGETFEGTVTAVHTSSGEAANGVTKYTADVTLDKTEQMLQGMNASVVVEVSSAEDCLMIPEAALQENGKTTTVYTTYDEATGTYGGETEVTTGVSDGTSVEILSGLSEGDTVYYSYTESSSDTMNFMPGMGGMQMPDGDSQKMNGQGKANGNRPDGAPGGSRQ